MIRTATGTMTFEAADALDGREQGGEEQEAAAMRLLSQSADLSALCAVALEYVRASIEGDGQTEADVALSVASAAECLAYKAYSDGTLALAALEGRGRA